ncbi:MAG: hypothetical protein HY420_05040 [Candidatus Kerfeldbacteria bacterium]|nr:hypothetical protein [Candidatus Kerfeldbacteria bacterium]
MSPVSIKHDRRGVSQLVGTIILLAAAFAAGEIVYFVTKENVAAETNGANFRVNPRQNVQNSNGNGNQNLNSNASASTD